MQASNWISTQNEQHYSRKPHLDQSFSQRKKYLKRGNLSRIIGDCNVSHVWFKTWNYDKLIKLFLKFWMMLCTQNSNNKQYKDRKLIISHMEFYLSEPFVLNLNEASNEHNMTSYLILMLPNNCIKLHVHCSASSSCGISNSMFPIHKSYLLWNTLGIWSHHW